MTHIKGRQDADLHHDNGEHRTTPPTTSGRAVARHETRVRAHLADHAQAQQASDAARLRDAADIAAGEHYRDAGVSKIRSQSGSVHEVDHVTDGLVHTKDHRVFRAGRTTSVAPETIDYAAAAANRGCYVQCMLCWAGAHNDCTSAACQCQARDGVNEKLVERMVQVNKL